MKDDLMNAYVLRKVKITKLISLKRSATANSVLTRKCFKIQHKYQILDLSVCGVIDDVMTLGPGPGLVSRYRKPVSYSSEQHTPKYTWTGRSTFTVL